MKARKVKLVKRSDDGGFSVGGKKDEKDVLLTAEALTSFHNSVASEQENERKVSASNAMKHGGSGNREIHFPLGHRRADSWWRSDHSDSSDSQIMSYGNPNQVGMDNCLLAASATGGRSYSACMMLGMQDEMARPVNTMADTGASFSVMCIDKLKDLKVPLQKFEGEQPSMGTESGENIYPIGFAEVSFVVFRRSSFLNQL